MPLARRYFFSILAALIAGYTVILLLASLTHTNDTLTINNSDARRITFTRELQDQQLENRSRLRPKPPKKAPPPPLPKIAISQQTPSPKLTPQKIDLPKLNLTDTFKGGLLVGANVGSMAMEVIPLVRIEPTYPMRAKRMRLEGSVTLHFTINPDGSVRNVTVKNSKPKRIFDQAAVRAIKRWKFKPKMVGGKAVAQEGEQTIQFSLRGNR